MQNRICTVSGKEWYYLCGYMKMTVYLGNKPIYLANQSNPLLNSLRHRPSTVWIDEISAHAIHALLHELSKPEIKAGVLWGDDFEILKSKFFQHFKLIVAAGGIVENADEKFLFIFRRGHWDLPKGKLDAEESLEECAKREIGEETGIWGLSTIKPLTSTYHLYDEQQKHILKETVWFHFRSNGLKELIPQTEEDITEAKWVSKAEIGELMNNSYATIRDVLTCFFN